MNQLLAKEPPVIIAKKERKKEKKFGAGLFLEEGYIEDQKEDDFATLVSKKPLPSRLNSGNDDDFINEELHVEQVLTAKNFMFPSAI